MAGVRDLVKAQTSYMDQKNPSMNGTVYVHLEKNNFYKQVGGSSKVKSLEAITKQEKIDIYNQHIASAKARIERLGKDGFDYESYVEATKTVVDVLDNLVDGSGQDNLVTKLHDAIKSRKEIGLSDFKKNRKTGEYSEKLKEIVKNINALQKLYNQVNSLVKEYENIDAEVVESARKRLDEVVVKENQLYILQEVDQAATSYKNIKKGLDTLKNIIKTMSDNGGVIPDKETTIEAQEIIRRFTGMLNNIQGIGYEAIFEALVSDENVEQLVVKELAAAIGVKSEDIRIVFDNNLGGGNTLETDTRATTDIAFTIHIDKGALKGSFDINLSAKSIAKKTKNGLKKGAVSYKSGRPWSRVGGELGLLNTEFEYWFANLSVKTTSRSRAASGTKVGKNAHLALREYIAARYALSAIAGTGESLPGSSVAGRDTVTHMVYLNKIVSVVDLLEEMRDKTGLGAALTKAAPVQDTIMQELVNKSGNAQVDRYVRSREVLNKVRQLTFTFKR